MSDMITAEEAGKLLQEIQTMSIGARFVTDVV